jgi:hypothetical protein
MKQNILVSLALLSTLAAGAQQTLCRFDWSDPGRIPAGASVLTNGGRVCLKIDHREGPPAAFRLLTIDRPAISNTLYAVTGEIQYQDVAGDSFLEMWNEFPQGRYFSRTLGEAGPMAKLHGTSDWRRFCLPFNRAGTSNAPRKLEINLCLKGKGTVLIGPLKLEQFPEGASVEEAVFSDAGSAENPGGWWSILAGIGIAVAGLAVAAGVSVVLALLARSGKARGLVLALAAALTLLGVGAAVAGIAGLATGQPGHVWGVLGFLAMTDLAVFPFLFNRFRKRYAEFELRRMASLDAQGV